MAIWIPSFAPIFSFVATTEPAPARLPPIRPAAISPKRRIRLRASSSPKAFPARKTAVQTVFDAFRCIRLTALYPYASVLIRLKLPETQFGPACAFQSAGGYFFGAL